MKVPFGGCSILDIRLPVGEYLSGKWMENGIQKQVSFYQYVKDTTLLETVSALMSGFSIPLRRLLVDLILLGSGTTSNVSFWDQGTLLLKGNERKDLGNILYALVVPKNVDANVSLVLAISPFSTCPYNL
ncbi:hypothetical protein H5410_044803 [Solanum commersonii]|uniref:Uncharacterized protein n=1 Tax=Solanum commersonii TaxID=4109 RepID=A0A9J5X7T7_SOLCO|nr:hypothetical protein H5410_044803 [Solanum commersonii]